MPGPGPGIPVLLSRGVKDVDGRDKPGHDESYGCSFRATYAAVILRSRALARRLEGWPHVPVPAAHPSRLALKKGEHLRMTAGSAAAHLQASLPNPRDAAISAAFIRSNRGDLHDYHVFADRVLASDAHAGRLCSPLRAVSVSIDRD